MKCLFLDAIEFATTKEQVAKVERMLNCLTVLVTFEKGDGEKQLGNLLKEIKKTTARIGTSNVMFAPFCHLSSNLMDGEKAEKFVVECEKRLSNEYVLAVSEFGVEKGLLLNIRRNKDCIQFREF